MMHAADYAVTLPPHRAGYSNSEIAERPLLSAKTTGSHISNIFSKLQVADRAQAIVRAREAGLGREGA